jgi:hypothetical protein
MGLESSQGLSSSSSEGGSGSNYLLDGYAVTSGTATYTATLSPALSAYEVGQTFRLYFNDANTGASTINLGPSAYTLQKSGGNALSANDILADTVYSVTIVSGSVAQIDIGTAISGTWAPTFTGFSVTPSNVTARYTMIPGTKWCLCHIQVATPGTSNAVTMTVTLPFPAANTDTQKWEMQGFNNTAAVSPPAMMRTQVNSAICDCFLNTANGAWTNSGTKAINGNFLYEIA